MFIIFSGLPGTGKSTLAFGLADQLDAVYVRIDTIEQATLASSVLIAKFVSLCGELGTNFAI